MIKVSSNDSVIEVTSPYNADFVKRVKQIGGKWSRDKGVWSVPEANSDALNNHLKEVYGYDVVDQETVTVEYLAADFDKVGGDIKIGVLSTAHRHHRDSPVKLNNDTTLISGSFSDSGGSRSHPAVEASYHEDDAILRTVLYKSIYEMLSDDDKAKLSVVKVKTEIEKLEEMKTALLSELEAIETKIKNLK